MTLAPETSPDMTAFIDHLNSEVDKLVALRDTRKVAADRSWANRAINLKLNLIARCESDDMTDDDRAEFARFMENR